MRRFYILDIQPSLFGGYTLVREWGRIGQAGTVRMSSFTTHNEAATALRLQQLLKEKRGYRTRN
ncbi:WGR domain-containing protein [Jiella mangrovi]